MKSNYTLGKKGEQIAAEYLEKKGMKIIATNFRYDRAEIDLIAKDKNELVFIEVKTRKTNTYGMPENSIGKRKLNQISKAAEEFISLYENKIEFDSVRIDVISIIIKKGKTEIEHFEDVSL